MKKVAIVGVEGSGKTVMLAGLGELYTRPDEDGHYLAPKNFTTASYVADKVARMRRGEWPTATAEDVLQGLDWTLRRKTGPTARPTDICQISCLDFAGEVYRAAFGIRASEPRPALASEVESLRAYVRSADTLVVLINLRDVIVAGLGDARVQEAMWITNEILSVAFDETGGRKPPRAAIVLSQADSYADTIRKCGGARGVLEQYLPHVANDYGWLDVFSASAVDRTVLNADGAVVPARDYSPEGLRPLIDWICRGLVDGPRAIRRAPQRMAVPRPDATAYAHAFEATQPKSRIGWWLLVIGALLGGGAGFYYHQQREAPVVPRPRPVTAEQRQVPPPAPVPEPQECSAETAVFERPGEETVRGDELDTLLEDLETELKPYEVTRYQAKAVAGDVDAQLRLACAYDKGLGVEQDVDEAIKWYRAAAEQGSALAQNNLGFAYSHGRGVGLDAAEAVKWYWKAVRQGYAAAQNNLGILYEKGKGVAQDFAKAFQLYYTSAKAGYMYGQWNLARLYETGRGTATDLPEAVRWYRKSAKQGCAEAKAALKRLGEKE